MRRVGLIISALGFFLFLGGFAAGPELVSELRAELIPQEGQRTAYGIPLSLGNAQTFADWHDAIVLTPEEEAVWYEALSFPAPCCADYPVYHCCCQDHGLICNLVRSAQGLGKWLIVHRGYGAVEVRAAVAEWLRFLAPNYYLALALEERGLEPAAFGMEPSEAYQACYRGWCNVPLDEGGCGGMGQEVKLAKPPAVPSCCLPQD